MELRLDYLSWSIGLYNNNNKNKSSTSESRKKRHARETQTQTHKLSLPWSTHSMIHNSTVL